MHIYDEALLAVKVAVGRATRETHEADDRSLVTIEYDIIRNFLSVIDSSLGLADSTEELEKAFEGLAACQHTTFSCHTTGRGESVLRCYSIKAVEKPDGASARRLLILQTKSSAKTSAHKTTGTHFSFHLAADICREDFVRDVSSLMNVFAIAIPNLSLELRIVDDVMITEAAHVAELSHEAWMSTSFQLGPAQAFIGSTVLEQDHVPSKRRKAMSCRAAVLLDSSPHGGPATDPGQLVVGVHLFRNNALLKGSPSLRMLEAVKNACWSSFGLEIQDAIQDNYGSCNLFFSSSSDPVASKLRMLVVNLRCPSAAKDKESASNCKISVSGPAEMEVKASVKKAMQEVKSCFPGHLLSKLEQKFAVCIPVVADSFTQLLFDCDNEAFQRQVCGLLDCRMDEIEGALREALVETATASSTPEEQSQWAPEE